MVIEKLQEKSEHRSIIAQQLFDKHFKLVAFFNYQLLVLPLLLISCMISEMLLDICVLVSSSGKESSII